MTEDEIQVLGNGNQEDDIAKDVHQLVWIRQMLWMAFVLLLCAVILWLCLPLLKKDALGKREQAKSAVEQVRDEVNRTDVRLYNRSGVYQCNEEGIYDVPLKIYQPMQMEAMLTMDVESLIDSTAMSSMLAVQTLEVNKRTGFPAGELVMDNQQLSSGKKRMGYCAIVKGAISIGMEEDNTVRDYCLQVGGCFFRQYPLVINGEVCINDSIRGKALRRALAKEQDYVYIIESENAESLYDFSVAIRGLGVSDALYLPRTGKNMYVHSCELMDDTHAKKNVAYLIFKFSE